MPLHTYKCTSPECDKRVEKLVKFSEAHDQQCECGQKQEIVLEYSGNFALKGRWYKTTRSY